MNELFQTKAQKTYYMVGDAGSELFRSTQLQNGNSMTVLDRESFDKAVAAGSEALRQRHEDLAPRFISPCPPPEGLERELLTILAEECCEVGQRVSKALRFGVEEIQPGQPLTNAQRISEEVGDIMGVVDRLVTLGLLSANDIKSASTAKHIKLKSYLQNLDNKK